MSDNIGNSSLGKGEVESSILSGSTSKLSENIKISRARSARARGRQAANPANERETRRENRCETGARLTQLYRHFDADGRLLYVGISLNAIGRLSRHKNGSHWFSKIACVKVENFPTREEAEAAEARAIFDEEPAYNKIYSKQNYDALPFQGGLTRKEIRDVIGKALWGPLLYWEKCQGLNICAPPEKYAKT